MRVCCSVVVVVWLCGAYGRAQVEHVPVVHPVYELLLHAEARGIMPNFSSVMLPIQRKEVVAALRAIRRADSLLSYTECQTLRLFEREFGITVAERAVVFASISDSTQLLFSRVITNDEKFLLHSASSSASVSIVPLMSLDMRWAQGGGAHGILGTIGGRVFGTVDSSLGFFLQGTSTAVLSSGAEFLREDPQLLKNPTFRLYNARFINWSEAHLRYDYRWLYASIGRETRLIGAGYGMRSIMSNNSIPVDAVMLGTRFPSVELLAPVGFEYRFMHCSLLAEPLDINGVINSRSAGAGTFVPPKFMALHRAALRGAWGELALWEAVVYNNRGVELAYITPFTFLKGSSDNLRDRDNALLGLDMTLRPISGIQVRGNFTLDDIEFGKIGVDSAGRSWWQNKIAWNLGVMMSPHRMPFDVTLEYSMVTPYTYTHFDRQNAMTQDGILFTGTLPPNSDEIMGQVRWFWGGRYPLSCTVAYRRHGRNLYNAQGDIVRNVGGDVLFSLRRDPQTFAYIDQQTVRFLEGDRVERLVIAVSAGIELVRNLNLQFIYRYTTARTDEAPIAWQPHVVGLVVRFEDF
ncbi:MAG: hypothetical protein RML40_09520 [Bacteroidota bacterium]|nr:hypothetical protein [Candidatus Kapabacteria bacterium]MDW8220756.1 hypothetical protein [Bacteroidota bacterium]